MRTGLYKGIRWNGGEDESKKGWEPRARRRPAFGARTHRKGRYPDPVTRKVAALNRFSPIPTPFHKGRGATAQRVHTVCAVVHFIAQKETLVKASK